jgi:hypothetical protein
MPYSSVSKGATSPPASPASRRRELDLILDLAVEPPKPSACGARIARITAHAALHCVCGARRGALSHTTIQFLAEVVSCFGAPTAPLISGGRRAHKFASNAAPATRAASNFQKLQTPLKSLFSPISKQLGPDAKLENGARSTLKGYGRTHEPMSGVIDMDLSA